jgi:hypothetical protein
MHSPLIRAFAIGLFAVGATTCKRSRLPSRAYELFGSENVEARRPASHRMENREAINL